MTVRKPHFLLYCDATTKASNSASATATTRSKWRCIVDDLSDNQRVEISDSEVDTTPERSSLIAVVRGLEALEQPSQVTLVTSSPYVNKGLRYGLQEWRENDYQWEHFGTEKPIRNADLWRRIDQALQYHSIDCRLIENASPSADTFSAEAVVGDSDNRHLRFDDAHPEFIRKSNTDKVKRRNPVPHIKRTCLQLFKCCRNVLSTVLCIPEYTIYAIESIVDLLLSLPHRTASSLMSAMSQARPWTSSRPNY